MPDGMLVLEVEMLKKYPSRSKFARASDLNTSLVCEVLNRRFVPYPGQLRKMAKALNWKGDPDELLKEVGGGE